MCVDTKLTKWRKTVLEDRSVSKWEICWVVEPDPVVVAVSEAVPEADPKAVSEAVSEI